MPRLAEEPDLSWEPFPSGELEADQRGALEEFRQDLDYAQENGARVIRPESFARHLDDTKAINGQMLQGIEKRMAGSGRHLYLSPDYAWLRRGSIRNFAVLKTAGAETSAHGVFFGSLTDAQGDNLLPVAIKPCRQKPVKAYADWLNNSLVAKTTQRHFKPVGFIIGEGANYSVTELAQGTEAQDNSDWNAVLLDESNPDYRGQRDLLKQIGITLATFHAKNIFHGDLQFKNIAVDAAGSLFFVDWESASFYSEEAPRDVRTNKAFHDLRVLFRSVACSEREDGVGLLHKFDPWTQWQYFKEYIFDPYMDKYLEEAKGESAFQQVAEVEEGLRDYILERGLQMSLSRQRHQ